MILSDLREALDVEESAHRGVDGGGAETIRSEAQSGRFGPGNGVSKHTLYSWKAKYGGMDVSEAQEAKQLRDEKREAEEAGRRPRPGQGCPAIADRKNGWGSQK
jgi:hypothetical protein